MSNKFNKKHRAIQDFLHEEAIALISDLDNYKKKENLSTEDLTCAYCKQTIKSSNIPDHFLLWNQNQTHFICFHIKCAFRKDANQDINEFLDNFDYRYKIKDG